MNAEKAAGPMEKPLNSLIKSYCQFPIKKCVKRHDCSSSGIWLYALVMSAVV